MQYARSGRYLSTGKGIVIGGLSIGMYARISAGANTLTAAAPWRGPTFRGLAIYSRCFENGVATDRR